MSVGAVLLALVALLLVAANLAYSLLSLACHRLRERRYPARLPLGIPLLGSALALVAAAWTVATGGQAWVAWLILLDTGGPIGWIVALLWRRMHALPKAGIPARMGALRQGRAGGIR